MNKLPEKCSDCEHRKTEQRGTASPRHYCGLIGTPYTTNLFGRRADCPAPYVTPDTESETPTPGTNHDDRDDPPRYWWQKL